MAFFDNIRFPFFTMQELNLDWILKELKRIAGFMPQGGNVGDLLTRKSDGAAWEPPEAVNININALPEDTEIGDNDQLIFYDISAQANRKIKPPNMLDSMMSNGTPLMDGTASAGTSKKPARYDHKHPTDTSRQAALSGVQMAAVNSGAPANSFDSNGVLKFDNGGLNNSAGNYCQMPDGTLIQWGKVSVPSGSFVGAITFDYSFVDTNYSLTFGSYGTGISVNISSKNTDGCGVGRTPNTANTDIDYIAIGRWK